MALIRCPECNKKISDKAKMCPKCGFEINQAIIQGIKQEKVKSRKKSKNKWINIILISIIIYSLGTLLETLDISPNKDKDSAPKYIKDVVAYKEGTYGIAIYFILADENGAMTISDGLATLNIYETYYGTTSDEYLKLYSKSVEVHKNDFYEAEIGIAALKHNAIIYSFGRIKYSNFYRNPTKSNGKVKVEFKLSDGHVIKGEDVIFF